MVLHLIPLLAALAGAASGAAIANSMGSKDNSDNYKSSINEKGFRESLKRIMQSHYANLQHYDWDGSIKTSLDRVATCSYGSCRCTDYKDAYRGLPKPNNASHKCSCGHELNSHREMDIEWLAKELAADTYETL